MGGSEGGGSEPFGKKSFQRGLGKALVGIRHVARGGTFHCSPISSFAAELFALEACTLFVKRLLEREFEHESLEKIRKMRI